MVSIVLVLYSIDMIFDEARLIYIFFLRETFFPTRFLDEVFDEAYVFTVIT